MEEKKTEEPAPPPAPAAEELAPAPIEEKPEEKKPFTIEDIIVEHVS
mgnify:CR=1 FL=1